MVLGMSTRNSGESRRGNNPVIKKDKTSSTNETTQQATTQTQHSQKYKPPSAEQVHIARMLSDNTPRNVDDLVKQVLAVVTRGEEDIIIALHDNDYNVEKTIEALLDNFDSVTDEWTTMGGKKGRKKQSESENEHSQTNKVKKNLESKGGTRRSNGPTSSETNESKVSRENRSQRGFNSGRNKRDIRRDGDGRSERVRGEGRRYDGRNNDRGRNSFGQKRDNSRSQQSPSSRVVTTPINKSVEANVDESKESNQLIKEWDVPLLNESSSWTEEWVLVDTPVISTNEQSVFPDALSTTTVSYPSTTTVQENVTYTNYTEEKRSQSVALLDDTTQHNVKSRRYKTSEIPLLPVEMPSYILDTLQFKLESLGIDFVGTETAPTNTDPPTSPLLMTPPTAKQTFQDIVSSQVTMVTQPPLTTSSTHYTSSLSEDTAVIAVSTNLSTSFSETPPTKLDPPPGLTHPSQQHASGNVATATNGLLSSNMAAPSPQTSTSLGNLHNALTSSNSVLNTSYPLQITTLDPPANISIANTQHSEPLFSSQPTTSVAMVTNPAPSHHIPHSTTSSSSSSSAGKVPHSGSSGGGNKVHSNVLPMAPAANTLVYPGPPHMLPQFPHYGTAPMMAMPHTYSYDVETLNRYHQQGFFNQHQTSTDVTLVSAAAPGVHSATNFSSDTKYDMTSPVAVGTANHNAQQQQGTIQNHPFYSYNYIMYPHQFSMPAGYSAQLNHKPPGNAATYPVGTSYQPTAQPQYNPLTYDDDYSKMYSGTMQKSNSGSSTSAGSDFSAYTKHHQQPFDTKGGGYGNYVPAAMGAPPMGGYLLGPPMGSALMTTPHESSSRTKHQKYASGPWSTVTHT